MRELSVYYCSKCGYYGFYQLPKNAVCRKCNDSMKLLDMNYNDFMNLDHAQRDVLLIKQMIQTSQTLSRRITVPEKIYSQRQLVGVMTQQILELEQEITKLNDTILWMHAAIWDTLGQNQKLKEENLQLKAALNQRI